MSIKLGITNVKPQGISKAYLGSDLVYQAQITDQYQWLLDLLSRCDQNNQNIKGFNIILNSQAFISNFNNIPFNQYENMIVRSTRDSSVTWYIDFIFFNNAPDFTMSNTSVNPSSPFPARRYRFEFVNIGNPRNTNI